MRISFVLKHALGLSLQCIQRVKITWPHLSEIHAIELCVPLSGSGTHNIYDSMFPVLLHILSHIRPFCLLVRQSVSQSISQFVTSSDWVSCTLPNRGAVKLLSKKTIKLRAIIRK